MKVEGSPTGKKKAPRSGSGLQDPAYDPMLLAVGAADTNGTADTHDDTVATFSSTQGTGKDGDRKPDLVAPGEHIASLRDPGSWIDQSYASTGAVNDRLMRGSGTSQAAAVVSGQPEVVSLHLEDIEYAYPVPTLERDRALSLIQPSMHSPLGLVPLPHEINLPNAFR